uniref:F-box protein 36b n=1 Tax=Neogobius melanostomus TaxID=47308 RepID=A0A8C6UK21_9GOBI
MASLLNEPLLEVSGRAPPPNTTFYYLSITKSEVIWRWWTISLRAVDRNARPGETKQSHQEMLEDIRFQAEIATVFGRDVLEHAKSLCQGHFNYLERLPDALLLRIMGFLELEDVGQLLRTSHRFWKLCQSEEFWENAVRQRCSTLPDEAVSLAYDIGWRRLFFTNKIQLQLLINRRLMQHLQLVEDTSGDMPEQPPVNKSPDSAHKKSETSTGSSSDEKRSNDDPFLSLSPDDNPSAPAHTQTPPQAQKKDLWMS